MSDSAAALIGVAGGALTVNLVSIPFWMWRQRREQRRFVRHAPG